MSRLVFITQQADPEHPVLAATLPKIRALAERVDEVVVLAAGGNAGALPGNARLVSYGAPTRAGRTVRFLRGLVPELRVDSTAVVAHMCPIYAVLAAPLARPRGVPVVLWFTQWRRSLRLRVAEQVSSAVVTAVPSSFPLSSGKVSAIGHGIDVAAFRSEPCQPREPLRAVALGRYSDSKRYDVIVRALVQAEGVCLTIHGAALTDADRARRAGLGRLGAALGVDDRLELKGPVLYSEVPALLGRFDLLVNATVAGSADKVVYEAAAAGRPALASAPAFADLLPPELRFEGERELAQRLQALGCAGASRGTLGEELRRKVVERHSVDSWAEAVLRVAGLS